ncbi:hypothetical protein BD413DRAFT_608297 [Trametes elegans]|nr:hypothetical protein BD413DRAFT_608297 [Trametes elegans]
MSSPRRALSPGSSLSSYDHFSAHSRSASQDASSGESDSYGTVSDDASSDDEIVLSFSDISALDVLSQRGDAPRTPGVFSDDEFVLMSRPRTPRSDDLTTSFSALSVGHSSPRSGSAASDSGTESTPSSPASKRRSKKKRAAQAPGNAAIASSPTKAKGLAKPSSDSLKSQSTKRAKRKARRAAARNGGDGAPGFGDRPIVDDVSEAGSEYPALNVPPAVYKSAQSYVSSILSADPSAQSGATKLAFLQALIIELGLYPSAPPHAGATTTPAPAHASFFSLPSLPGSLRAAKALLKSQVYMNVRDYLAVRSQGVDALRRVMHPSRSALLREIRGGKRAPVKAVKESGLSVLLVTCYR